MRIPDGPMLAAPLHDFGLPQGWVAEPKWDGYRAFLAVLPEKEMVLRSRNGKTETAAARTASEIQAHFVAFDLLHWSGTDYASRPYSERRDALEQLFATCGLQASWALSPMTTLVDVARGWLAWNTVGIEGIVVKTLVSGTCRVSGRGGSTTYGRARRGSSER